MTSSAEQCAVQEQCAAAVVVDSREHVRQLQSDEHKDHAVENEVQGAPDRPGLQAHAGGEESGTSAAEIESAGHHGEHAGSAHAVRGEIGGVGDQDAERDLDGAVVNAAFDSIHDPAGDEADGHASHDEISQS